MAKRGVNKVILIGNLGANPEVRYSPQGNAICNMNLATSDAWKDKNTGEMQEKTEWHKLVAFQRLAEICGEILKKGSKIYVEGQLKTRKWQDNNGVDRYSTEVVVNEMQALDPKGSQEQKPKEANGNIAPPDIDEGFEDDIPF